MKKIVLIALVFLSVYNTAFSQDMISAERSESFTQFARNSYDLMAPRPSEPTSEQCKEEISKLKAIIDKQKEIIKALEEELKKCKEKSNGKNH